MDISREERLMKLGAARSKATGQSHPSVNLASDVAGFLVGALSRMADRLDLSLEAAYDQLAHDHHGSPGRVELPPPAPSTPEILLLTPGLD
jgi:hypothetical protein